MLKLALTALAAAFARGRGECFSDPGVALSADECACHATCETCGYAADPSGRADCVTCADGSKVREVYADGTGICAGDDLAEICEDTCASANDGLCDDGSATRFAGESACPCGSDCGDCGARTPQACADAARGAAVDEAEDAADGAVETAIEEIFCAVYENPRLCEDDGEYWCCDRNSDFPKCGSAYGYCEDSISNKAASKIAIGVVVTIVIIVVAVLGGVIGCCVCCSRNRKAAAANRAGGGPPAPGWLSNPNAPILYVDPLAPPAVEASYVMHSQSKYDGPDGEPTTPAAVAGPAESTTDILGAQSYPAESTADILGAQS